MSVVRGQPCQASGIWHRSGRRAPGGRGRGTNIVRLVSVLASALDPRGAQYASRRSAMLGRLAELDAEHAKALAGGGPRYTQRHRARGKLMARERIELLIDPDSPFLELSPLAGYGTGFPVGGSVVTGIGVVCDTECVLIASDPTVRGGSTNPWTLRKSLRAADLALRNRLPLINLGASGGPSASRCTARRSCSGSCPRT